MGSEAAFADSSFFYALAAKRDPAHEAAVSILSKLLRARRRVITTDYIIDEALTLTKARTNATVALALMDRIDRSEVIEVKLIDPARFQAASTFFRKRADHDYSFTDCTSFVIMRELKITDALTTDGHFAAAGFRPLLIPGY